MLPFVTRSNEFLFYSLRIITLSKKTAYEIILGNVSSIKKEKVGTPRSCYDLIYSDEVELKFPERAETSRAERVPSQVELGHFFFSS